MKKIFFTILTGTLCFCISCSNEKSADNAVATKNLEAANAVNKAIQTGDVSTLGDQIAVDGIDHGGEHGDVIGLDSIKSELATMHSMYSDMKMDVIKELADSSYVFQWIQFSGTCTVASMGMPAGTKVNMSSIEVSKFKDGKAVEHWTFMQPSDMMKMMPSSDMNQHMMMDTTKKM
jgi:predicted ester cyclase